MTHEEFDAILMKINNPNDRLDFINKFFFHGIPYVFEGRENDYFEFRNRIAKHFSIHFQEVFIVGSAKLGFSFIKGTKFSYDSDIDVVIVNDKLFEYYLEKTCNYQYHMDRMLLQLTHNVQ